MEMAVPMVCFCDIPLSKVKSHMNMYGHYGIGLSKSWGIKAGISPLFYISQESSTTNSIYLTLAHLKNHPRFGQDESLDRQYDRMLRLIRFTKPYQGAFFRKGRYLRSTVVFYNEREWRYIPDISDRNNAKLVRLAKPWIDKETYLTLREEDANGSREIDAWNEEVRAIFPLKFDTKAIKYIILKKENEILPLLRTLENIYNNEEISIISSKILTKKQIFEDF